jgi:hypothetical protein
MTRKERSVNTKPPKRTIGLGAAASTGPRSGAGGDPDRFDKGIDFYKNFLQIIDMGTAIRIYLLIAVKLC